MGGVFAFQQRYGYFKYVLLDSASKDLEEQQVEKQKDEAREIFHFSKTLSLWPSWNEPSPHTDVLSFQHWRRMKWMLAAENGIIAGGGHNCCGGASQREGGFCLSSSRQINF